VGQQQMWASVSLCRAAPQAGLLAQGLPCIDEGSIHKGLPFALQVTMGVGSWACREVPTSCTPKPFRWGQCRCTSPRHACMTAGLVLLEQLQDDTGRRDLLAAVVLTSGCCANVLSSRLVVTHIHNCCLLSRQLGAGQP
jgi:hypothetical protein